MPTDWIRKHVKPSLVAKYEREMKKLRGETSNIEHVVDNIYNLNEQVEKIESDEERRAKALAEDEEMEKYFQQNKGKL